MRPEVLRVTNQQLAAFERYLDELEYNYTHLQMNKYLLLYRGELSAYCDLCMLGGGECCSDQCAGECSGRSGEGNGEAMVVAVVMGLVSDILQNPL